MDKRKSQISKNILIIKIYNKGKTFYEPYEALTPKASKYDLPSSKGQSSHHSSPSDSYKFIRPYIQKTNLLHVCYLDEDLEKI